MVDLKCCLGKNHIAKKARQLPCGSIYCFECLRVLLVANNEFKCCCQSVHNIGDLERVPEATNFESILMESADDLINQMSKELNDTLKNAKSLCSGRNNMMENFFNFIKEDVEIRVESIKIHLDSIAENFYEKLNLLKNETENRLNTMNTYFNDNLSVYEEFLSKLQTKNDTNRLDKIYECQNYITNMNEFEQDFYTNLRNVSFRPNESFNAIDETLIGSLKTPILDINKLRTNLPKKFNCNIKICALCELNETQLAAIDYRRNDLIVLNKDFQIEKQISQIKDENNTIELNLPKAICLNSNTKDLYVVDTGNNRIILLDNSLTKIKKIVGEKGNTEAKFNRPYDLQFINNLLYILDSGNKRIQVFNEDLQFIREIRLYKTINHAQQPSNLLSYPIHITMNNDFIAINDNNDFIFIYNYDGQLITSIEIEHLQTFLFIGSYLMAHKIDGSFLCFDCDFDKKAGFIDGNQFLPIFHRFIGGLQHFASSMKYMDGNLIIPLSTKKSVVSFKIDRFSI